MGRTALQTPLKLYAHVYEAIIQLGCHMEGLVLVFLCGMGGGSPHDLTCRTWPHGTPRSSSLQASQCHPYRSFSQALKSSSVFCVLLTATAWNCAIMASPYLSGWVCVCLSPSASHAGCSACFWALRGQAWSAFPSGNGLLCDLTCCLGYCIIL